MFRIIILCFIAWILSPSCVQESKAQNPLRSAIPVLKVKNDTVSTSLQISSLAIDIAVAGNIATTTFDLTFYNALDKVIEGEFEFPLSEGQNISRYALDMNGHLREGVVVEKAKARVAFENTVRRGIDPGLAEKTKGNNFRTRIYPIPAKGYKRVVIGIEQTLDFVNKALLYQLPLYSAWPIDNFSIKTTAHAADVKPALEDNRLNNFAFKKLKNDWIAEYTAKNFIPNNTITFSIPFAGSNNYQVFTEDHEGKTYFYLTTAMNEGNESKRKPEKITVLWDISSSGEKRNTVKERGLLEKYISSLQNVSVEVIPFNIVQLEREVFTIKNGDSHALMKRLQQYNFDGGTQLGILDLNRYKADEILLFSDGLSTFGKDEIRLSAVPVTTISSSPNADFSYLKYISRQTHGRFVNLTKTEIETAFADLEKEPLLCISTVFNKADAEDVQIETGAAIHNSFSMAGILKESAATITVDFGYGNIIRKSRVYRISKKEADKYDNVKRIWASMKIEQLDLQYKKNKELITELGKRFSIVTQNTSLLVLDRVEDYVKYEIVPPAELKKEYLALLNEKHTEKIDEHKMATDEAADAMKKLNSWWKSHPLTKTGKARITRFTPPQIVADTEAAEPPSAANLSETKIGTINQEGIKDEGFAAPATSSVFKAEEQNKLVVQDVMLENVTVGYQISQKSKGLDVTSKSSIELNGWKPETPYLKILEATSKNKYFEKFMALKKDYLNQPSFFVDVARFFYDNNDKKSALQVLSNISEMKLEDAELLRTVANQLLEAGETLLAIETFKEILEIGEEEPQSYRDLALALNEGGQYNEAIQLLYKVVTGIWDSRFGGMKEVALNEMNAIISSHPGKADIRGIDKKFITAMPVDVRIVIGWSSDNADVDLWVTEPNKEKCFYENQLTQMGGRISEDVTQGYGPEEYLIRKAANGTYKVEVNLYGDSRQTLGGPITVKAELFTNFGRSNQKRKVINFRVTTNKEVVKIGEMKFESGSSR